jgi:uncharacterized protein YukE
MPDFGGVRIDVPIDFGDVGPKIMSIAHNIGEELGRLERELMPLAEFWMGGSKEEWLKTQTRWNNSAHVLMAAEGQLGDIGHAVNTNWMNYQTVEHDNASMLRTSD